MNRWSVIVYGVKSVLKHPRSASADVMKRYFELDRIVDGDDPRHDCLPVKGALILTELRPSLSFTRENRNVSVFTIDEVKERLGAKWQD